MEEKERDELRKIQNSVISLAEKQGLKDEDKIIDSITLKNIRECIYPHYKSIFKAVLDDRNI